MNKEQKRLCWARNIIKKWDSETPRRATGIEFNYEFEIRREVAAKRYERAVALILADRLRKS